jgi:hypothetical protein
MLRFIAHLVLGAFLALSLQAMARGHGGSHSDFLGANGCMFYQEYLFGRLVPREVFDPLMSMRW